VAEVGVRHDLVAIGEREHRAGDERAEDHLETELRGDGREADEQDHRAADADLRRRVLEPQEVGADRAGQLRPSERRERDDAEDDDAPDEHQGRADAALAGEEQRQEDDRAEVRDRARRDDELPERR
jgi:hypothetical protein